MGKYDKEVGDIAMAYLKMRSADVAHFNRNGRDMAFNFAEMLQGGLLCHRSLCMPFVTDFTDELAEFLFDVPMRQKSARISSQFFERMCYIYVLYILNYEGFPLGQKGAVKIKEYARKCSVTEDDMFWFFEKVTDDLWEIGRGDKLAHQPELPLAYMHGKEANKNGAP